MSKARVVPISNRIPPFPASETVRDRRLLRRVALSEILKLMGDGNVLRPEAFRLAADYFAAHPEVDIVFGQTDIWEEQGGTARCVQEMRSLDTSALTLRHWLRETRRVTSLAAFIRAGSSS
ncbi:MAG: hypothetical protein ABSH01_02565 [Terriglobia bacterium]